MATRCSTFANGVWQPNQLISERFSILNEKVIKTQCNLTALMSSISCFYLSHSHRLFCFSPSVHAWTHTPCWVITSLAASPCCLLETISFQFLHRQLLSPLSLSICHGQELSSFVGTVCEGSTGSWSSVHVCSGWHFRTACACLPGDAVQTLEAFMLHTTPPPLPPGSVVTYLCVDVDRAVCCRPLGLHIRSVEENSRSKREGIFQDDDCIIKINDTELTDKSFSQWVNDSAGEKPLASAVGKILLFFSFFYSVAPSSSSVFRSLSFISVLSWSLKQTALTRSIVVRIRHISAVHNIGRVSKAVEAWLGQKHLF